MICIDGSMGEGGGQILRTSVGLGSLTGQSVRINNIRAGRQNPGLRPQHLAAMRAARDITEGTLTGDALGSTEVEFSPGSVRPGKYRFRIDTAGSTCLLLQTVLPALMQASKKSKLTIEGGTHVSMAPSTDYLQYTFLPLLSAMGPQVQIRTVVPGIYPRGGGRLEVTIEPSPIQALSLCERGALKREHVEITSENLPEHVAKRERIQICQSLGWDLGQARTMPKQGMTQPINIITFHGIYDHIHTVFNAYGQKGVHTHRVVTQLLDEVEPYRHALAPVDPHLADQLLIPMALAGRSVFRTTAVTPHTQTNMDVIAHFLPVRFVHTTPAQDVHQMEVLTLSEL